MKLVIDIPEERYELMKEKSMFGRVDVWKDAIRNGTPLPKGHGRLIDADALRTSFRESIEECRKWANEVDTDTMMYARISQSVGTFVEASLRTQAQPTIIEADEEADE